MLVHAKLSLFAFFLYVAQAFAAETISLPLTQLRYFPSGVGNATGELSVGPSFGDMSKGEHGTFVKMPAGFVSDVHIHTHDYHAVVISGVGVNTKVGGGKDVALPVGSYWLQKGGEPHVTKCISPTECIFYLSQDDAFDYSPAKK